VVEEWNRLFDVDIFLDTDSGSFKRDYISVATLPDALNLVCIPLDLK
jgi:hypothetical protein